MPRIAKIPDAEPKTPSRRTITKTDMSNKKTPKRATRTSQSVCPDQCKTPRRSTRLHLMETTPDQRSENRPKLPKSEKSKSRRLLNHQQSTIIDETIGSPQKIRKAISPLLFEIDDMPKINGTDQVIVEEAEEDLPESNSQMHRISNNSSLMEFQGFDGSKCDSSDLINTKNDVASNINGLKNIDKKYANIWNVTNLSEKAKSPEKLTETRTENSENVDILNETVSIASEKVESPKKLMEKFSENVDILDETVSISFEKSKSPKKLTETITEKVENPDNLDETVSISFEKSKSPKKITETADNPSISDESGCIASEKIQSPDKLTETINEIAENLDISNECVFIASEKVESPENLTETITETAENPCISNESDIISSENPDRIVVATEIVKNETIAEISNSTGILKMMDCNEENLNNDKTGFINDNKAIDDDNKDGTFEIVENSITNDRVSDGETKKTDTQNPELDETSSNATFEIDDENEIKNETKPNRYSIIDLTDSPAAVNNDSDLIEIPDDLDDSPLPVAAAQQQQQPQQPFKAENIVPNEPLAIKSFLLRKTPKRLQQSFQNKLTNMSIISSPLITPLKSIRKRSFSVTDVEKKKVTFNQTEQINIISPSERKQQMRKRSLSTTEVAKAPMLKALQDPDCMIKSNKKFVTKAPPDFSSIHNRQFEKMESIVDYNQRKRDRAKILLSSQKNKSFNNDSKTSNNSSNVVSTSTSLATSTSIATSTSTSSTYHHRPVPAQKNLLQLFSAKSIEQKTFPSSTLSSSSSSKPLNQFNKQQSQNTLPIIPKDNNKKLAAEMGVNRRLDMYKSSKARIDVNQQRQNQSKIIKGVRSNRRFDLQMQFRNNIQQETAAAAAAAAVATPKK